MNQENAERLRAELELAERRISRLTSLVEAAKILNSTLNLDELLTVIMEVATEQMNCDRSTLFLLDEEKKELVSKIAQRAEVSEIRVPLGSGLAGYAAESGETINIADAYKDPRFNPAVDKKTGYRTRTILTMPMRNRRGKVIGVLQVLNKKEGIFTNEDEYFLEVLSSQAAVAIENARLHHEELEKKKIESELNVAYEIQKNLLPKSRVEITGYDLAGLNYPAKHIGGDYYDFIPLSENRFGIAIGDVSGKGVPAALLMANLQASIRAQIEFGLSPKEILSRSNLLLYRSSTPEKFITFFYCLLDSLGHKLVFSNAGHNLPLLRHPDGSFSMLETPGLVLGILEDAEYCEDHYEMQPGDTIVFYTDGVIESSNVAGDEFGEDRLKEIIEDKHKASAQELIDTIYNEVQSFSAGLPQHDDITIIALKRE